MGGGVVLFLCVCVCVSCVGGWGGDLVWSFSLSFCFFQLVIFNPFVRELDGID